MNVELHPGQSEVYNTLFIEKTCRHCVVIASRGWGKSYFAATAGSTGVIELMELDESVPNKNVYIIAPTYSQVQDIYLPLMMYHIGIGQYANKILKDTGTFEYPKGVTLRLVSFEAIERLRGSGAYLVICDETSSWTKGLGHKEAWQGVIEPCITTRWSPENAARYGASSPGRSITITTPKGYNFSYDMFNYAEVDPDWASFHFDYTTSPYLSLKEIEKIKKRVDPLEFAREYLASFEESGNSVFYCFDRKVHVSDQVADFYPPEGNEPGEDVHIAMDFNVGIQASSAWAIRGGQPQCIEEFQGYPDTETIAKYLSKKYKGHKIYVYPDPSGNARKTSAPIGVTDFSILRKYGLHVLARSKAPPIIDSVQAVNRKLKNAAGDINCFIHPRCEGVIKSLERTSWVDNNPDVAMIDKSEGIEHFSDGIRYFFEYMWPVVATSKRVYKGHNF